MTNVCRRRRRRSPDSKIYTNPRGVRVDSNFSERGRIGRPSNANMTTDASTDTGISSGLWMFGVVLFAGLGTGIGNLVYFVFLILTGSQNYVDYKYVGSVNLIMMALILLSFILAHKTKKERSLV